MILSRWSKLLLVFFLLVSPCQAAQDIIEAPEENESIAVESINEEVRKLYVDIKTNTTSIATNAASIAAISSTVVQVVNVQDGEYAAYAQTGGGGDVHIPYDDTKPQITEGSELMTLAITPTIATNILKIEVNMIASNSRTNNRITAALFQDATASALWAGVHGAYATSIVNVSYTYYIVAGTTSSTTFRVRGGGHESGTFYFNGEVGAAKYDGICASSITIWELVP